MRNAEDNEETEAEREERRQRWLVQQLPPSPQQSLDFPAGRLSRRPASATSTRARNNRAERRGRPVSAGPTRKLGGGWQAPDAAPLHSAYITGKQHVTGDLYDSSRLFAEAAARCARCVR